MTRSDTILPFRTPCVKKTALNVDHPPLRRRQRPRHADLGNLAPDAVRLPAHRRHPRRPQRLHLGPRGQRRRRPNPAGQPHGGPATAGHAASNIQLRQHRAEAPSMNDAIDPSDQRTSPPDGNQDNRPEAPELPSRPPPPKDDGWPQSETNPGQATQHENDSPGSVRDMTGNTSTAGGSRTNAPQRRPPSHRTPRPWPIRGARHCAARETNPRPSLSSRRTKSGSTPERTAATTSATHPTVAKTRRPAGQPATAAATRT